MHWCFEIGLVPLLWGHCLLAQWVQAPLWLHLDQMQGLWKEGASHYTTSNRCSEFAGVYEETAFIFFIIQGNFLRERFKFLIHFVIVVLLCTILYHFEQHNADSSNSFFVWLNYILGFPNHLQLVWRPAPKLNFPRNKLISPPTRFHRLSFIDKVIN